MSRLVLVRPGSGSPDLLPLEAWQALTRAPVFAAPGAPLGERLREAGYEVTMLPEAEPSPLRSETPGRDAAGMLGRNLLATHQHGEVSEGARALAERLASLAIERGEVAFILNDEAVTRAVLERGMQGDVEIEFVMGRAPRGHRLLDLVAVMAKLRGPGGCPWDAEQTHQTLAKHLLDETYELLEAIDPRSWNPAELNKELSRALSTVDDARTEYNQQRSRLNATTDANEAVPLPETASGLESGMEMTRTFGQWLKIGFAFTLPLIIFGLIALFIFYWMSGPTR